MLALMRSNSTHIWKSDFSVCLWFGHVFPKHAISEVSKFHFWSYLVRYFETEDSINGIDFNLESTQVFKKSFKLFPLSQEVFKTKRDYSLILECWQMLAQPASTFRYRSSLILSERGFVVSIKIHRVREARIMQSCRLFTTGRITGFNLG